MYGWMVVSTMASGSRTRYTAVGSSPGKMEESTLASTKMTQNLDMESLTGQTGDITRVAGRTESSTARELMSRKTELLSTEYGIEGDVSPPGPVI